MIRESLPIDPHLPGILRSLTERGALVLQAPTGSGKTTRVPPALVGSTGQVILVEPRRMAARAAARRIAQEHGSPLGEFSGYQVRFDRQVTARTRVIAMTPGLLLRRLQDDPFLEQASVIIFDEFHERGVDADLALGMVRLVRQTVRPDLKIVIMSATLDPQPLVDYLGNAAVHHSEGRTYPVTIRYQPRRSPEPWPDVAARAVRSALDNDPGDILVFLPGFREIQQTADRLSDLVERGIAVLPLHGELPPEQQDRALTKLPQRKIVLATNVAEASVTVEGVTIVIDTGIARQMEFDADLGMDHLRLVPISKASADQRAGRAGRTAPGICLRLWEELQHRARADQTIPEICRVDLAGPILQLLALGENDVTAFPLLDPMAPSAVDRSFDLLEQLGAVEGRALTDLGNHLARLPVHPRLGRLLLAGVEYGVPGRAALAAALLSERDPLRNDAGPDQSSHATSSDLLDRIEAIEQFEQTGRLGLFHRGSLHNLLRVRDQLLRLTEDLPRGNPTYDADEAILRAIWTAYPDRLARRRARHDRRGRLVGGRGIRLAPSSGVIDPELFVAVDVDAGGAESWVRSSSEVRRAWILDNRIVTEIALQFDESTEKLTAVRLQRYGDLVLDEVTVQVPDTPATAERLAQEARQRWDRVVPQADSAASRFRTRVEWLRGMMPDLDLPGLDDASLQEWLPEMCQGCRSLAEVRNGPWLDRMRSRFTYPQLQLIDREAPEHLTVPTGSEIALQYELGRPPILAVRIQELFGWVESPRLAGGRVKILFHLLAPNYRPQQVTDDLASFWRNGYPIVRKELRGRYPKHSWPEDPLTAEAIRGPKRRPES